jgi:hypothetical protein
MGAGLHPGKDGSNWIHERIVFDPRSLDIEAQIFKCFADRQTRSAVPLNEDRGKILARSLLMELQRSGELSMGNGKQ